jgi:hypothetical protein
MSYLSLNPKIYIYLCSVIWFLASLYLVSMSAFSITYFDHSSHLFNASESMDFDDYFTEKASSILGIRHQDMKNVVLHISSRKPCLCEYISQRHIASVKNKANDQNKRYIDVNIESIPEFSRIIPSTPAIAIFDRKGNLSYLGGYSEGAGCFTGKGIAESFLIKDAKFGATIMTDSSGCYCNNKS